MSDYQILIEDSSIFKQVLVLNNNEIEDYKIESSKVSSLVGNIYMGKVVNMLDSVNGFFVDIGRKKNAFLDYDSVVNTPLNKKELKLGSEVLVQVLKDEIGDKGAVVTTKLEVSKGSFVMLLDESRVRLSSRINGDDVRNNLKDLVSKAKVKDVGILCRTSSVDLSEEEIESQIGEINKLYKKLKKSLNLRNKNKLLYKSNQMLIDVINKYLDKEPVITVNNPDDLKLVSNLTVHKGIDIQLEEKSVILRKYSILNKIDDLLSKEVMLFGGGSIVLDKTEAMTVVDVNSGASVDRYKGDELKLKVNLTAVREVFTQVKLRNISGIILIDAIDFKDKNNYNFMSEEIDEIVKESDLDIRFHGISKLGILEFTRKRTSKSLLDVLGDMSEYITYKILVEIDRLKEHQSLEMVAFEINPKAFMFIDKDSVIYQQGIEVFFKPGLVDEFKIIRTGRKEFVKNQMGY